jgi:hypothetical protein
MTKYHIHGQPLWIPVARVVVPIALLLLCFMCGRACFRAHLASYTVMLVPDNEGGNRSLHDVELYSMADPRWTSVPMGKTGKTIGQSGGAVVCAAMAFSLFGSDLTPGQVAEGLDAKAFQSAGNLDWDQVIRCRGLKVPLRVEHDGLPSGERVEEALMKRQAAIALVPETGETAARWVIFVGKTPKTYTVVDPETGARVPLSRYSNRVRRLVILNIDRQF